MTEIPEPIWAMDRLNSWLRSPSAHRGGYSTPYRAIYFLKREAIEWADANLECLHSAVKVKAKCRDCGGTGKYTDSYGYEWPHCRACSNRGSLALEFVQTIIRGGPVWHTPWLKFYVYRGQRYSGYRLSIPLGLVRGADEEWSVYQAGRDMTPEEVARDLNTIEGFWTKRPAPYYTDYGGPFDDFKYKLYVGATDPSRCSLCGSFSEEPYRYGVSRSCIEWSDHACKVCANLYKHSAKVFDLFPIPQPLLRSSHIQRFIERRSCVRELIDCVAQ